MSQPVVPAVGDLVRVSKFVYDTTYYEEGAVTEVKWDARYRAMAIIVNGDYFVLDGATTCVPVQPEGVRCRRCEMVGVEMTPVVVSQNYDEDGKPDDGGCFSESHYEWECADAAACQKRRADMWTVLKQVAVGADAAAREAGWGAIGI